MWMNIHNLVEEDIRNHLYRVSYLVQKSNHKDETDSGPWWDHLIFIMRIPIWVRQHLYIESAPGLCITWCFGLIQQQEYGFFYGKFVVNEFVPNIFVFKIITSTLYSSLFMIYAYVAIFVIYVFVSSSATETDRSSGWLSTLVISGDVEVCFQRP